MPSGAIAIAEGESTPVIGVQPLRLARMQPAGPASGVRRPVAASRENTISESAEAPATYAKRPSGEIAIASAPASEGATSQPGTSVVVAQPARPASCTSEPLGWRA